ncbi:MocR-like pyridoxine biosynthesis transcription factor PdxR [Clostridium brassicae]|uniref:PLP-dependent aminotransferase family protein n=1 Tax=Clostridium brassicae TaxID=2999072 RepID=A0ABT4DC39_9CLOT|nr:PLP-dependent aminotransferase family protein [Clostridium brassicae]MCY6958594.1 PLP-dependent aminotransferase family protein [Clostridium brassicae]
MEKYLLNLDEEMPKYLQISKHIEKLINEKKVKDGERLPAIRTLAKFLDVNTVTIVSAYKLLQQKGYALQKMGSGTYAKGKEERKNFLKQYSNIYKKVSGESLKGYIDFSGETTCSEFFPVETFKKVLNDVLDRDGAEAFVYQSAFGYEGLRKSINNHFWDKRIDTDNIMIVSGAQQGIDIVAKALINVNDNIAIEKPTYSGALNVFKGRRANIFEIDMLRDGIDIGAFKKILKKNKINCFYIMSYFQNPTGSTYSMQKKREILNLAEEYDFYILEDDYLSELIFDKDMEYKSFKSLDTNDRVIYVKSFSKIFLPGIRLGYLVSPYKFKDRIQSSKINTDITTSSLMQRALDLYIKEGYWKDHMKNLNEAYKERYNLMKNYIEEILKDKVEVNMPGGGLHFYLKISDKINVDCLELFYKCKKEKVIITPGVLFYKNNFDGEKYFRLGFSQTNVNDIEKGLNIINRILRSFTS